MTASLYTRQHNALPPQPEWVEYDGAKINNFIYININDPVQGVVYTHRKKEKLWKETVIVGGFPIYLLWHIIEPKEETQFHLFDKVQLACKAILGIMLCWSG